MPEVVSGAVLVVDDDERSLELMKIVLGHAGYRVLTAPDGHVAIDLLATEVPQLVLADMMMPGMTGVELCQWVRGQPRLAATRFLLLTGMDDEDTRAQARSAGVDDVVVKPFERASLLRRLAAVLSSAGA